MRKYGTGKVEVDENDEQGVDREKLAKQANEDRETPQVKRESEDAGDAD